MKTCVVCGDKYCSKSWGGPAEPCNCGAMVSQADAREMESSQFDELVDDWAKRQSGHPAYEGSDPDGVR